MAVIMVLSMLPMSVFAAEPAAPEVVSQQLNLSDDLTMRFYVKADSNTVVNATVAGVTNAYDLSTMTADENGQYVVPVSLAAAQMTEVITLDFLQNGENVLQKTYTIRDYAVTILEGNYPARTKKMVRYMLHYGAKAQQYFDVNTGSLVNVGYEITEEAALPSEYEAMSVSGSVSGLRFYGTSLVFENKIAVRYYFTGSVEGVDFGDYDAISKGDMYYVEVPGINPQDYAKNITLTVTKGEETLAVSYSPLNYIIRMSEKSNDELKALLNALYGYHTAAIEYVKNKEQEGMFFGSAGSFVSSPVIDLSTDCGEMPYLVLDAHKSTPLYTYIANLNTQNFSFETTVKVDSVIENENYPKLGMLVNGQTEMVKFYLDMNPELQVPQVGAVHQNTGKDDDWAYTSVTTLSEALDLSTNTVMLKLVRDGVNYYFYVNGAMVLAGNDLTDENGAVGFFSFGTELTLTDYTVAAAGADYEQALTQAKADAEAFNQVRNQILQTSTSYTVEELKLGAKLWNGRGFVFTELPEALIGQSYVYGKFNTQIDMTVLQDGYLYVLTPPTNHANFPDNILSEGSGFAQLSIAEDWCLANYSNPINTLVYERAVKPGENITIDASWAIVVVSKDRLNLYPLLMPNDTTTVKTVAIGEKVWSDEDKAYTFISMPEALIGQQYLYGSILGGVDVTAGRDGYFYVITHPRTDSNFAASVDNYNFKRLELPEWTFADYTVKRNTWVYELRVSRGERIQLAPWWGVLIGSETQLDLTGNGITVPGSQLAVIESDSYASVPVALKQQVFSDQTPYYYHTIPYWMAGKSFLCAPLNGGSATVTKAGKLYLIGRNQANGQQYLDKGFTHVMDLDFEPWGGAGLGGGNFAAMGFALYQKDVTVGETVTWGRWGVPLFYSDAKLPAEPITGLQSLSIDQMPTKTTYKLGESFDATGLVVTGIDRNGQKIIIDSEHYLLAPAVLSADVPAVSVIVDDKICAIPVTVTDENGKDLTDYSPADMSGFTTQKAPIITGSISLSTVDSIVSTIKKEEADGATGFIVYLTTLAESERTVENLKRIADCTQYPVMALAYGNYDNLEMRLNLWRMAVQAGFDAVDIPMDTYSVSYDACKESYKDTVFASAAPKEVSMDAEVIAQQKAFMAELRAMNPDVEILMSAHVGVAMNQSQGVALAKEMESRGADIAKIVLASSSDLEEALQTNMVLQEELNVPFFYNCAGAASRPYRTAAGLMGTQVVFCCAPYHEINAYVYDYAKDLRAFYNTIPELYQEPKGEENAEGVSLSTDYFLKTEDGKYTLSTADYTDAMVDSVKLDGAVVNAASYRVKGSLSLTAANTWGQARILATADDHNGYVIALEKVGENAYQIFTMSRLNESSWNDWRLISHFEVNGNRNSIDFELVVDGSKITFLLDDQVCYKNSRAVMTTSTPQFGASNVATATVSGLAVQVFADSAEAQAYLATKEQAAYVSRFQTRMDALYNEYIVENNCTNKGGTLIMGDSYMDFWSTWETQTGLTKYEDGYNVGIGGSAVKDWLLAYEQLVKPFAAERIILNIGYNDINVWGDNGEEFTQNLKTLFETIHADFPETEIYYIYINPSPSVYANGAYTNWKVEDAINRSKELVAGLDYVTGVDIFDLMTTEDGKNPVAAYYVSDNIHLSAAGYSVLSNHLRQVIFGLEPVEGYHFGNAEGYVTTGGIDLSNDTEENGTVSVNGGGTQYGYLKNSFADKLYVEAEFQVSQILNNDAWPKFGLMLNGETEMVSFYVDMTTNLTSQAVGIVHCPTGGSYDWGNSVQTAVSGMAFTGENKVKLAVVRDGSDVYFYVNNVLVMKKIGVLATENTVAGIFTFNTQLTVSNYILKTGDAAADAIAKAKADCAFFGTANGMQTSQGVDLSKDHGEYVGVATVNSAGDQTLYVKNHYEQTFYFETNVHVDAILAENTAPMVGLQAQNDTKAVRFYLSLAADKSVSGAGCMINGENAVTANVENVDLAEEGCYATLGILKDGDKLHFFVNGSYVMTCQDTLAGNATAGAFSVDAGMELKDYSIILSGAKLNAMRALVPTDYIVSLNSNGTIQTAAEGSVIWSDKDYLFVSLPDALKGTSFVQGPIGEGVDVNVTKEGYLYVITPQRGAVDTCAITLDNYNFERLDMEMWRFCDASNNSVWVYEKKVNPGDVYKLARWAVVFTSTQKLDLTASAVIPESNAELAILQSVDGYKAGNLAMDSLVFADRTYAFNNVPYYLAGKNYIVNNYTDKDQSAVAIREGYVYMYTNTSTFTATTTLQDQGFTVVDNNAVHLFTAGTFNNYGFSLLKKYVRAGEVITWNQWAIPVFSGDLDISGGMIEDDSQLAILESNDGYTVKALALNEQVFSDRTAYVFSVMPSWAVGKSYIYGKYADTDQSATATRAGYVYMLTNTGTIHVASDLISKGFTLVSDDAVHLFTGGAFHTRGYSLLKKYVAQGETISWGQWAIPIFCGDASATENTYVNIAKLQAAQTSKVSTLEPGVRLFNDRLYYLRYDLPEALNGKSYIYDTIAGGYATVVEGGKVYMMIPVRCTMYKDLVAQVEADGWTPSAYRIFRFSPGLEYACRLYEKVVTAGETIHYSKYNVLIFDAVEGEGGYEMPSLTTGANVLTAPQGANYSPSEQNWLGCPTLEITDQGRIWASWFTGGEWELSTGNFALVSYSDDGAQSWNHAAYAVEHSDKAVQVTKPEFWTDPDGRLWLFWVQHTGTGNFDGRMGVWASVCAEPDAATPVWSEPQRLSDGYLRSKPIVLQSGEWIYSAFDWMEPHKTAVYISTDKGATWTLHGKAECLDASAGKNNLDDPTLVEKLDGTLWLIIRTDDGPYESFSYDKGVTWTHAVKSSIQGPATRMTIDRLDSGNLLMVYHDAADRSRLTAYLSTDDGATWQYKLLLDERSGVTYPDTVQTSDGTIYVIYDRGRTNVKEILLTRFTEQDVISGEYTDSTWQKVLVNK